MIIDDKPRKRVPKAVSEKFDKDDYLVQIHNENLGREDGSLAPLTYMVLWLSLNEKPLVTSGNYTYIREKDYNEYVKGSVIPNIKLCSKLMELETKDKKTEKKLKGFLHKQVYVLVPNSEIHAWWTKVFTDKEKVLKLDNVAVINKKYYESKIKNLESYVEERNSKIGVQ